MKKAKKIWLNGKFLDWEKAKIHVLTHSLHYGSAVFEGIRAYPTEKGLAVFRLPEHIDRLFYSASVLGMKIPFSRKKIKAAILRTIKNNQLKECYIRPIAFFGEKMGLNPAGVLVNLAIVAFPWRGLFEKKKIKVKISKFIRIHPRSTAADAKISGHYINSILATLEAKKEGFDEAILLDFKGNVAEGPGENIFLVKGKKIFTPSPGAILPGITRRTIIEVAKSLGYSVFEKKIRPEELKKADELFFAGTGVEICPIMKINDVLINQGKLGEITQKIKKNYQKIVKGKEKKYFKWLTFIN
jgi:branched-chain amino acid aminotransferase